MSLAYIYNFDIVSSKKFDYTTFKFKIWDMFSNFLLDNNELALKISLYDPNYFMPS